MICISPVHAPYALLSVGIGELATHANIISSYPTVNVHSISELNALDANTESIIVEDGRCNNEDFTELDLSRFTNLKSFIVGDRCFGGVTSLHVDGLQYLETIKIGMSSFSSTYGSNYSFAVKNCPSLKELKIGPSSFEYWNQVEIENLPSLEVIEMGYLYYYGPNFKYASLELKSDGDARS